MPGYPKVDRESDFLISRFDGAILDAKPWGRGALEEPPSAESLGYMGLQADTLAQLHGLEVGRLLCFVPHTKVSTPSEFTVFIVDERVRACIKVSILS